MRSGLTETAELIESFDRASLIAWFAANGRDLPWRHSRDPWLILVAEVMLQQTQAARVAERLGPFLDRFRSPTEMADAPVAAVITAWQGMGYNRRAVQLHRSATAVRDSHGGQIPADLKQLMALPGIGPYTARAVLAFAFEADVAVVDTNIARVLHRQSNQYLAPRATQSLADALVPVSNGWVWNQAIMELGAIRCGRRPKCGDCPVEPSCGWVRAGRPSPDPARRPDRTGRVERFEGSDRQGRGRLVDMLRLRSVAESELGIVMGWPDDPDRARRVADGIVRDGLALVVHGHYRLP